MLDIAYIKQEISLGRDVEDLAEELGIEPWVLRYDLQRMKISVRKIRGEKILEILKEKRITFFNSPRVQRLFFQITKRPVTTKTIGNACIYLSEKGFIKKFGQHSWERIEDEETKKILKKQSVKA